MPYIAQPLSISGPTGRDLARLPAPKPEALIRPKSYATNDIPYSDQALGDTYTPGPLALTEIENVAIFKKNVFVSLESGQLLRQSFLRGKYKHHGGIVLDRKSEKGSEIYNIRGGVNLDITVRCSSPAYIADTDKPDVYGHILLEVLPRLWAFPHADKNTKIFTSARLTNNYLKLFKALGVSPDSIFSIEFPVIAEKALFASLPVVRREWIHPVAFEIFDRLKSFGKRSDCIFPERIYISRSRVQGRELLNENEIEAYFRYKGFSIIHPQELPIEDQIGLFANAKLIAGSGGSAMHNAVFAPRESKVLIACSRRWLVNADILLSQTEGRLGYVFGDTVEHTEDGHRSQSPWSIDMKDVALAIKQHFEI